MNAQRLSQIIAMCQKQLLQPHRFQQENTLEFAVGLSQFLTQNQVHHTLQTNQQQHWIIHTMETSWDSQGPQATERWHKNHPLEDQKWTAVPNTPNHQPEITREILECLQHLAEPTPKMPDITVFVKETKEKPNREHQQKLFERLHPFLTMTHGEIRWKPNRTPGEREICFAEFQRHFDLI